MTTRLNSLRLTISHVVLWCCALCTLSAAGQQPFVTFTSHFKLDLGSPTPNVHSLPPGYEGTSSKIVPDFESIVQFNTQWGTYQYHEAKVDWNEDYTFSITGPQFPDEGYTTAVSAGYTHF